MGCDLQRCVFNWLYFLVHKYEAETQASVYTKCQFWIFKDIEVFLNLQVFSEVSKPQFLVNFGESTGDYFGW